MRKYTLGARSETAAETRQRVVQATYELHRTRGIAATSFRDIAERADVAIGTVYHHFPEYDDVIRACGAHTMVVSRPPTAAMFDGIRSPRERLRVLVRELFRFYDRIPEYERIHAERERFAFVSEAFQHIESARRTLIAAAVRPRRIGKRVGAAAFAMLEPAVHRALVASGLSTDHAAEVIFRALEHIIFRRTSR